MNRITAEYLLVFHDRDRAELSRPIVKAAENGSVDITEGICIEFLIFPGIDDSHAHPGQIAFNSL